MGLGLIWRTGVRHRVPLGQCRQWSCTATCESGHNRWSKIRHDKAKEDAVKSKERTLLSQEVILASKFGGPDPIYNSRLALAITNAKRGQLSKTSIDSAIAKGQGKSTSGAALEPITIEAMLPFGVAAIIEYQTDSKARILQDIRSIIKDCGGTVTPTAFLFDKRGRVWFDQQDGYGVDEIMDQAIEAGAEDIFSDEDKVVVETQPTEVTAVAHKLQDMLPLKVHKTELAYIPKRESTISLSEEQGEELQSILDSIEEEQSLQGLYVNAIPA